MEITTIGDAGADIEPGTAEAEIQADQATIAQFTAARDKLVSLRDELATEEAAIEANKERYVEATRLHAAGRDADPGGILANTDRRGHRIAGLRTLIAEQEEVFRALEKPFRAATLRELDRRIAGHVQTLTTAIADADTKAAAAQKALDGTLAEVRRLRLDLDEVIRSRQPHHRAAHQQRSA